MQREWTVIFIVYAFLKKDDKLREHLEFFKKEILKSSIKDNNSYYLLLNEIDDTKPKNEPHDQTILYNFVTNGSKTELNELKTFYTEHLMQKPEKIKDALKTMSSHENFNAKKIAVFTWDHGAGFGIFSVEEDKLLLRGIESVLKEPKGFLQNLSLEKRADSIPPIQVYNRWWDESISASRRTLRVEDLLLDYMKDKDIGFINNNKPKLTYDMLYNEDLSAALREGLGRKVDIVLMANCYMQNLHTASAFVNNIDILIAPQGDLEYPCYNYSDLIFKIEAEPSISSKKFATFIVDQASVTFKNEPKYLEMLSLFAVKLAKLDTILKEISIIALFLDERIKSTPDFKYSLPDIIDSCFQFETDRPYSLRDMLNFLHQIKIHNWTPEERKQFYNSISPFINDFIITLTSLCTNYILAKHTGKDFIKYADDYTNYVTNILPKAVCLYLPDRRDLIKYDEIKTIAYKSDLIETIPEWGSFIIDLHTLN